MDKLTRIAGLFIFLMTSQVSASIVTYNFSGEITYVVDRSSLLSSANRNFQIGEQFQAIYEIETGTRMSSGSLGGEFNASYFSNAITNFQFYVGNINLVDSDYRVQALRVFNGWINSKPADTVEILTDGGIDNYSNSYGENSYHEFIDSRLILGDLTGTALDAYNQSYTGNIPLSFNMDDFSFGYISIVGESSLDSEAFHYQLGGNITSFSSEGFKRIPSPTIVWLLFSGLIGLWLSKITGRRR